MVRVSEPARRKRSGSRSPDAPHDTPAAEAVPQQLIVRLQRSAGNKAVGRVLSEGSGRFLQRDGKKRKAAPSISVRKGSKLSAEGFLSALKKNKKVPGWLKKSLGSKGRSLVLTGRVRFPTDRIWLFVDPLVSAFEARNWEITTARSRIEVTKGAGNKLTWRQIVTPDLTSRERIGSWNRTGPGRRTFSPTILHSESAEIIYGWTLPREASNRETKKRNLIAIVTEIEVIAPDGKKKVFKPDADSVAEAIIHEISVHAGRISQGDPDEHDHTNAVIADIADQVGEFFRPTDSSGDLRWSKVTSEIFRFVRRP